MQRLLLGSSLGIAMVTLALSSPNATAPIVLASVAQAPPDAADPAVDSIVHLEIPMQSFDRYVEHALDVVRVTVTGAENLAEEEAMPLTVYRAQVVDSIKGLAGGEIEIRVAGGVGSDGALTLVRGAPHFELGDELVLFLCSAEESSWFGVLGLSGGAYRIQFSESGNETVSGLYSAGESPEDFLQRVLDTWVAIESGR